MKTCVLGIPLGSLHLVSIGAVAVAMEEFGLTLSTVGLEVMVAIGLV